MLRHCKIEGRQYPFEAKCDQMDLEGIPFRHSCGFYNMETYQNINTLVSYLFLSSAHSSIQWKQCGYACVFSTCPFICPLQAVSVCVFCTNKLQQDKTPESYLYASQQPLPNIPPRNYLPNSFSFHSPFHHTNKRTNNKFPTKQINTTTMDLLPRMFYVRGREWLVPTQLRITMCPCTSQHNVVLCLVVPLSMHFPKTHYLKHSTVYKIHDIAFPYCARSVGTF